MSTEQNDERRSVILDEIRQTGPISVDDVVRNLTGEVPRSAVVRTVYEATETGELDMDIQGRLRVRGGEKPAPRRFLSCLRGDPETS